MSDSEKTLLKEESLPWTGKTPVPAIFQSSLQNDNLRIHLGVQA